MYRMKHIRSCGVITFRVIDGVREYILVRHNKPQGYWSIPKGHKESDETDIQTAIRELQEESGCEVSVIDGFCYSIQYNPAKDVDKTVVFFTGVLHRQDSIVENGEIVEYVWLPLHQACVRVSHPLQKEALLKADEFLEVHYSNSY